MKQARISVALTGTPMILGSGVVGLFLLVLSLADCAAVMPGSTRLQDSAPAPFTLLSEADFQAWPLLLAQADPQVHRPTSGASTSQADRLVDGLTWVESHVRSFPSRPSAMVLAQAARPASGPAVDPCPALTRRLDIDLKEVVQAGCEPSQTQIAQLLDNPVGNLIILLNQFDYLQIKGPQTGKIRDLFMYKLIPTFPLPLGAHWNLINRVALSVPSVPVKKEAGDLIGLSPSEVVQHPELFTVLRDPFGRTTGFGDLAYVGLFAPKQSIKTEAGGAFIWGVGPTFIFPTASARVLGQGKYQVGPAAVFAYLGPEWILGVFPQQWWSYAGDDQRRDTSQMNLQYFIYRKLPHDISIGMSPNITINWKADAGNQVTLPIGLGGNFMMKVGKVPVRIGLEAHYAVIHPHDVAGSRWDIRFLFAPVIPTFLF